MQLMLPLRSTVLQEDRHGVKGLEFPGTALGPKKSLGACGSQCHSVKVKVRSVPTQPPPLHRRGGQATQ